MAELPLLHKQLQDQNQVLLSLQQQRNALWKQIQVQMANLTTTRLRIEQELQQMSRSTRRSSHSADETTIATNVSD